MMRLVTMLILFMWVSPGCETEDNASVPTEDATVSNEWVGDAVVEWSADPDVEGEGQWQGGTMATPEFPQWSGE